MPRNRCDAEDCDQFHCRECGTHMLEECEPSRLCQHCEDRMDADQELNPFPPAAGDEILGQGVRAAQVDAKLAAFERDGFVVFGGDELADPGVLFDSLRGILGED